MPHVGGCFHIMDMKDAKGKGTCVVTKTLLLFLLARLFN